MSVENGHGGARPNSGGARPNSGGARIGAGRPRKAAVPPPTGTLRWYAVRAARGYERDADIEIRLAGIPLFAPTLFRAAIPTGKRPGGGYRPARGARIEYLFWRVMFVSLNLADPAWRDVLELTVPSPEGGLQCVVERFITGPGSRRPTPVPDGAIDKVRVLLSPNGCLYPRNHVMTEDLRPGGPLIDAGAALRVLDGPLADHAATCEISDGKRIEMLTSMFNRDNVRLRARQSAVEMIQGLAERQGQTIPI